jgi:hypothetical protein
MSTTATAQDYQVGAAALATVIAAAIKANVPEFLQSDVPAGLVQQIEQQGAKAVIDAVDAHRAKQDSAKGMD